MKRLLLVAYHFPPIQGSTGMSRSLAFARHLGEHGWEVKVLTVKMRAYQSIDELNLSLIPEEVEVIRAPAWDTQQHFSIRNRYPRFLALPDRWQSWIPGGIAAGLRVSRGWSPDVIMSTYPIASAHCIGYALHRLTGTPWVAEFRDPMAQEGYPRDPHTHRVFEHIEDLVFGYAARVVVTTPGCAERYRSRFSTFPTESIGVIPNGYDAELFPEPGIYQHCTQGARRRLHILHSGLLYPDERNPEHLFRALAELQSEGRLDVKDVVFAFRASGNESRYRREIQVLGLEPLVKLLPAIAYREAISEMMQADACLIMQGSSCNEQIPAKLYEYFYSGRPILGLTDPCGDTAKAMVKAGVSTICPMDDTASIKREVASFLDNLRRGTAPTADRIHVERYSRRRLTGDLAGMLNSVTSGEPSESS